ncbi:30S ribosomal protein S20 [bacterium]|nr:30S ribosomal protein S20 [bacterium]
MPRIKSSVRDVRKNKKQRAINRAGMSTLKTAIRKTRTSTEENWISNSNNSNKVIDKAVQHGLIHKNTGARYKSRLAKAKKPEAATA